MAQLPTLFLCGLAYLGVKYMCSVIPQPPETPVTVSSSAMTELPTTTPIGLPNGWQACIDQAGNTYYQNLITQQTQWEHPAPSAIHDGVHNQRVDVFGSRFGGLGLFHTSPNHHLIQASQALGTTHPVGPVQTLALTRELDEDASTMDKAMAAKDLIVEISKRLIFIIPKLIKGGSNLQLWLYVIDLVLLGYFALKQRYCPGCLYNCLHVLIKGKTLKPLFVSIKSRRFSGTKKLIVGVGAIATLVQVVESISEVYCFFTAEIPWQQRSPSDIAETFVLAAGVLMNSLQSLVAVVAYVTFFCFGMLAYLRFYLSCLIACELCKAKSKLRTQQSSLERGVDQRHIFQKVGGVFSSQYSKDSVNQRNVENAEREVASLSSAGGKKFCGFSIPDLGSNAGTGMYKFWALIWESLDDNLVGTLLTPMGKTLLRLCSKQGQQLPHLHLQPAGIVAEEGEREMGALFGLQTKDIQIQRSMQPGPDGMAGIGMRFVCVAGSLEPGIHTNAHKFSPHIPRRLSSSSSSPNSLLMRLAELNIDRRFSLLYSRTPNPYTPNPGLRQLWWRS
jgi:hypothetical protein